MQQCKICKKYENTEFTKTNIEKIANCFKIKSNKKIRMEKMKTKINYRK